MPLLNERADRQLTSSTWDPDALARSTPTGERIRGKFRLTKLSKVVAKQHLIVHQLVFNYRMCILHIIFVEELEVLMKHGPTFDGISSHGTHI